MTITTPSVSVSYCQLVEGGDDEEMNYYPTDVKLMNAKLRYKELMVSAFGITLPHTSMW